MKRILAFGDSNTWGYDPATGQRYDETIRWTGLLQKALGEQALILEEGLCGRTTVFEDTDRVGRNGLAALPSVLRRSEPLDAAIIMLGTNDCKTIFNANPHIIGKGLELCLDELEKYIAPEKILVISPIKLGSDVYLPEKDPEFDKTSIDTSRELKREYEKIAKRRGNQFLAASDYADPSAVDDEHMDEKGHEKLSEAIINKLEEMKIAG